MFRKILVPTDGSELSQSCIEKTVSYAAETGARIVFLCVRPQTPMPYLGLGAIADSHIMQEAGERLQVLADENLAAAMAVAQAANVEAEAISMCGDHPWELIIQVAQAQQCDAVFMASHGRRGVSSVLLGSETQKVLTHCDIPVLVYR